MIRAGMKCKCLRARGLSPQMGTSRQACHRGSLRPASTKPVCQARLAHPNRLCPGIGCQSARTWPHAPHPSLLRCPDACALVGRLADVVDFDGWRRRRLRRHHLHRPEDLREAEGVSPTLNSLTPTLPTHAAGEGPEEPRMPASHPSVRAPTCVCVHVWWLYRVVRDANRSLAPGGVAWHAGSHS